METFYSEKRPLVLQHRDNALKAAMFLAQERSWPFRSYLAGSEELGEPADIFINCQKSAQLLAEAIRESKSALRMGHFPATSCFVQALEKAFEGTGLVLSEALQGTPYIKIDETCLEPLTRFSGRYRSDFRRMQRRAESLGEVTFQIIKPNLEALEELFSAAILVESKG